jgi:hypothetical protein
MPIKTVKAKIGKPMPIKLPTPEDRQDPKRVTLDTILGQDLAVNRNQKLAYVAGQKLLWRLQEDRSGTPTMTPLFEIQPHERQDMIKLSRELARRGA